MSEQKFSRFDSDPEAIAWARSKVKWAVRQAELFEKQANDARNPKSGQRWHLVAGYMRRALLGGQGCAIAAFDERLPEWVGRINGATMAPADNAVKSEPFLRILKWHIGEVERQRRAPQSLTINEAEAERFGITEKILSAFGIPIKRDDTVPAGLARLALDDTSMYEFELPGGAE